MMVVFHELGDCTIVFGNLSDTIEQGTRTVRYDSYFYDQNIKSFRDDLTTWSSSSISCQSRSEMPFHMVIMDYKNSLEFDGSADPVNRKASVVYSPIGPSFLDLDPGRISYHISTSSWKFGATIVCGVRIELEDVQFITNLGAERRMHVLVGNATRECAPHPYFS